MVICQLKLPSLVAQNRVIPSYQSCTTWLLNLFCCQLSMIVNSTDIWWALNEPKSFAMQLMLWFSLMFTLIWPGCKYTTSCLGTVASQMPKSIMTKWRHFLFLEETHGMYGKDHCLLWISITYTPWKVISFWYACNFFLWSKVKYNELTLSLRWSQILILLLRSALLVHCLL